MAEIDIALPHYEVRVFLSKGKPGTEFDRKFAELVCIESGPSYSTDLNAVVGAIEKHGWWWHLSHLEAIVTPTKHAEGSGGMLSNSTAYGPEGRPIRYSAMNGGQPAMALCVAWVKAEYDLPDAFYVEASHVYNLQRRNLISSGVVNV